MNQEYNESTYGDRVADVYDHWHASAPIDAIARLKELAGAGPVLELGIGTGRLAIPLWIDWQKSPFVPESQNHISIYQLP
jgi:hypothetical protein